MKKLLVYADFDWLDAIELVGELSMDSIRGGETYGFEFAREWLKKHGDVVLSDDLNNYVGMQYTQQGKDIFGCFSDSLPDRWGRTLALRREQIVAAEEKRAVRRLTSMDFLLGIDDASRMGGFRFKETQEREFVNAIGELTIPPITSIRELIAASQEIELSEERNMLPEKKWLMQLVQPGTSLGGARPKASVVDEKRRLYVAKFPSRKDLYDVGLWEHFAHLMGKAAGIDCAETRVINAGQKHHTLLSRRFDRTEMGRRIHFASAMTMLGLTDGQNATTGHGYLDIVDFIVQGCCDVEHNLEELFRRVAFNIAIGNSDDHFRNHGFLLTSRGWTLSPAYDLNPTLAREQSLLINAYTTEANLDILQESCNDYMLSATTATRIIEDVRNAMKRWKQVATMVGIAPSEQKMFKGRFEVFME